MRINTDFMVLFLFVLFVWLLLHSCNVTVHAHDTHVSDKPWTAPVTWVAPDTFKDAADKCWHVYKAIEPNTLLQVKLHIEEVTCP